MKTCNKCIHLKVCEYRGVLIDKENTCPDFDSKPQYGRWLKINNGFKCSECGEEAATQFSYCPDCGASMIYEVL